MSHIFDALQRAESDRRGVPLRFSSRATELLERAEAEAVSSWKDAVAEAPEMGEADHELAGCDAVDGKGKDRSPGPAIRSTEPLRPAWTCFVELHSTIGPESRLVSLEQNPTPAAEAFRLLAVRLRHMRKDRPLRRVLITGTTPQEGKSLISGNIACALAQVKSQKVLLVDGDLRRPRLAKMLGVNPVSGLAEGLQSDLEPEAMIYSVGGTGLYLLPAGNAPANPLGLLQSPKLPALIDRVSNWFDWVIIDSPPALPFADTSIWARMADGILLVTRHGTTEKRKLERGLDALDTNKIVGAILNSSSATVEKDYYYYGSQRGGAM